MVQGNNVAQFLLCPSNPCILYSYTLLDLVVEVSAVSCPPTYFMLHIYVTSDLNERCAIWASATGDQQSLCD